MSAPPWRLVALGPLPVDAVQGMLPAGLPLQAAVPATRDRAGLHEALADAELVLADWSGQLRLGPDEAAAASRLGLVQIMGAGADTVDVEAFAAAGIPVANTAGQNAIAVAEWCVAATLASLRSLVWADAEVRAGRWPQLEVSARGSSELGGRRVGILGFGPIGAHCARVFTAFGCPVSYWSRRRREAEEEAGATYRELDDLLRSSDVLVVVIALGATTRGLLDADRLALLPRGAVLVNAARGGVVDEAALLAAVEGGALGGAALDVFGTEPLAVGSPLRKNDRILLSPHAAGTTQQSLARIIGAVQENLRRAVSGEPVSFVLNGVSPAIARRLS